MDKTRTPSWFPGTPPSADARLVLYAFPHAGGGAAVFKDWQEGLPPEIAVRPVQYPGREARFGEPLHHSVRELVDALEPAIVPELSRPFAFFGHSLGGFVAYELVRRLQARGGPLPVHLFLSAARAPHTALPSRPLYSMDEPELLLELRKMGGTPERVLAEPELMRLFLPLLRADFTMSDCYLRPDDDPLLAPPLSVFRGATDDRVNADKVAAWQERAAGAYQLRTIPGGHFFIQGERRVVLDAIATDLAPHLST